MPKGIYKRKVPVWNKGKTGMKYPNRKKPIPFSLEHKKKISDNSKSGWKNKIIREKRIKGMKGRTFSMEVREKIRLSNLGKKHSPEAIEKMRLAKIGKTQSFISRQKKSNALKGEKAPNWKGGLTLKNHLIRHSLEYRLWRESVFKRDNYTCVWCEARNGNGDTIILNADHIKPFALYPELRFAIDNGRTLCVTCHKTTDTFAGKGQKRTKDEVKLLIAEAKKLGIVAKVQEEI